MKGHLEVICGPMFCGKSEELVRRIRRYRIAGKEVLVFKHHSDTRYDENNLVSHAGTQIEAFPLKEFSSLILEFNKPDIIAIDEIQFFNFETITWIEVCLEQGIGIIVAGLDQTYRGEGFGIMPELMAMADKLDKLTAICQKCGEEATMTQRLIDGKPAPYSGETVIVGANEQYEARCRNCHEVGT